MRIKTITGLSEKTSGGTHPPHGAPPNSTGEIEMALGEANTVGRGGLFAQEIHVHGGVPKKLNDNFPEA